MSVSIYGNKSIFAVESEYFDEFHTTEIKMFIHDINILAFTRDGEHLTTRWELDELAEWLRGFVDNMREDPYPVEVEGAYAALMDINSRNFDSEDDEVFDEYYDKLDDWVWRHTWHHASSGAILSDIYFRLIGEQVEISWNNQNHEEGVQFDAVLGCDYVPREIFVEVINHFLRDYADHWFN